MPVSFLFISNVAKDKIKHILSNFITSGSLVSSNVKIPKVGLFDRILGSVLNVPSFSLMYTNIWISGDPGIRTTELPFQTSQTSWDTEDIYSTSAAAWFSLARPTIERSHAGPPVLIAPTIAVRIPRGAMAKMILSAIVKEWLMNCFANCSPNSASSLQWMVTSVVWTKQRYLRWQIREQIVGKLVPIIVCSQYPSNQRHQYCRYPPSPSPILVHHVDHLSSPPCQGKRCL